MRARSALLVLAMAALAVVPVGSARAAAACNLVVDRTGDGSDLAGSNESLDIVSADLASDATTITAVLRVKKLLETSPTTPQARNYYLLFTSKKPVARLFLTATLYQGGVARYGWGTVAPVDPLGVLTLYDDGQGVLNQATGSLDLAKNEIRISALVSDLSAKGSVKPGEQITRIQADTFYTVGNFIFEADTAQAKSPYVAGSPSCVKPRA
jgi:hypothetical protein